MKSEYQTFEKVLATLDAENQGAVMSVADDCFMALLWMEDHDIKATAADILVFAKEIARRREMKRRQASQHPGAPVQEFEVIKSNVPRWW